MNLVAPEEVQESLAKFCVPPISEFDSVLGACWGIPRNINLRKSKNGKWFAVIDLIDSNSKLTNFAIGVLIKILYVMRFFSMKFI